MATTLQGIRDFARAVLQTDDTDLPNSLVDVFANEAATRINGMRDDWPHMYSEGTLAMISGTNKYTLASASFNPQTLTTIESVWDDAVFGSSLFQIDFQEAAATWIGPSGAVSSTPAFFSVHAGFLYLWPFPNATRSLRVAGYRSMTQMVNVGDAPDLPAEFHSAVLYGTAAIAYAQQEDESLSQFWRNMANESAEVAKRNLFMNRRHRPIMLHGRGQNMFISYDEWVRRNVV